MKRGVLLGLLLSLLLPSMVVAASYSAIITVTESGGSTHPRLPILATVNNTQLVSDAFISSTGLDTRVLESGSELPHMVADDKVLFSAPIAANNQHLFEYITGDSLLTSFHTIVGRLGYVTTSDDSNIEPGNDFEVEVKSIFSTAEGESNCFVYKQDAFVIYGDGLNTVTAGLPGAETQTTPTGHEDPDSEWTNETNAYDDNNTTYATSSTIAQNNWSTFVEINIIPSVRVESIRFIGLTVAGAIEQVDLDYYYCGEWVDLHEGSFSNTPTWNTYNFGGVLDISRVRFRFYNVNVTPVNARLHEVDFGVMNLTVGVSATDVATGTNTIKVTGESGGGDLGLYINDVLKDTDTYTSVTDNSNDYIFLKYVPSAEYIKITVSSTLQLHYQPNDMVFGTDLYEYNHIPNGRFEIGNPPTDWSYGGAVVSRTAEQSHDGNYAAKIVSNGIAWFNANFSGYEDYKGKPVSFGIWYYALSTNDLSPVLRITDNIDTTDSSSFTKDDAWHWLTVTHTVNANATHLRCAYISGGTDYDDIVYLDGTRASPGSALQDGVITWGTNPTNMTVVFGALLPGTQSTATVTEGDIPSFAPTTEDTGAITTSGVEGVGFPFYAMFKGLLEDWADLGGPNISMPYFWKFMAVIIGWIFGTAVMLLTRNVFAGLIAYFIGFAVPAGAMGGVLDMWVPIVYGLGALAASLLVAKWGASSL